MVHREPCTHCKGNRYILLRTSQGKDSWRKCPHCAGQGFTLRLSKR